MQVPQELPQESTLHRQLAVWHSQFVQTPPMHFWLVPQHAVPHCCEAAQLSSHSRVAEEQIWLPTQVVQAAPLVPHPEVDVPDSQTPLRQQPDGQVDAEQVEVLWQLPLTQV